MAGAAPTAKPAPFLRPLDLLDRGFLLGESALSLVIVMVMVLVAVADAATQILGRFSPRVQAFMLPLTSVSGDVMQHGTLWAAFLGASFATRGRKHLAIDALGRLLPDRGRRAVVGIASTLGAVVAFTLARGLWLSLVEDRHAADELLADLARSGGQARGDERAYEFHYVMPAGFFLISLRLLMHAFHEFAAGLSGALSHKETPKSEPSVPFREGNDPATRNDADMVEPVNGAPVSHATGMEIGIALVMLLGLPLLVRGSSTFRQLGISCLLAAATLAIPLFLRWQKTKSTAPTVARESEAPPPYTPVQLVAAVACVVAVILVARLGIANITKVPTAWGVAFFAFMAIIGAPLFTFLSGLALFLWTHGSADVAAMTLPNSVSDAFGPHFARMSVLPTIPVFTLAGYLMSESKTPQRLVRVARAFLGWMPGGLAVVCLMASAFFTVFSGASGITIVAIGGLLYPALVKDKYSEKFSLGLVTTGGALGITFPPALPLIVYGIVAGLQEAPAGHERLELQKFMLAGVVPGLLTIALLVVYSIVMGVVAKVPRSKFDGKEAMAALWETKWEIFLPFFLLGGLATGVLNPSTAAAFTAFYVLVIEVFIYKDLSLTKDLPRIVPESMILVGAIFVKLCAATVLTAYFIQAQTADKLFEWLTCGPPAAALHAHARRYDRDLSRSGRHPCARRSGVGRHHQLEVVVPHRPQPVPARCGHVDGHLLRDRRDRAAHLGHRAALRHQSVPSRHRVPAEPRDRLPDAADGAESVHRRIPIQSTGARPLSNGVAVHRAFHRVAHDDHVHPEHHVVGGELAQGGRGTSRGRTTARVGTRAAGSDEYAAGCNCRCWSRCR